MTKHRGTQARGKAKTRKATPKARGARATKKPARKAPAAKRAVGKRPAKKASAAKRKIAKAATRCKPAKALTKRKPSAAAKRKSAAPAKRKTTVATKRKPTKALAKRRPAKAVAKRRPSAAAKRKSAAPAKRKTAVATKRKPTKALAKRTPTAATKRKSAAPAKHKTANSVAKRKPTKPAAKRKPVAAATRRKPAAKRKSAVGAKRKPTKALAKRKPLAATKRRPAKQVAERKPVATRSTIRAIAPKGSAAAAKRGGESGTGSAARPACLEPPREAPLEIADSRSAVRVGRLPPRASSNAAQPAPKPSSVTTATWKAAQTMAERLGAAQLSDLQKRVIGAGLEGRNVVATFAAGEGKSTCAAILAQLCGGVAVILSPSPRLTREQQQRLEHRRIPAARLDPSPSQAERGKLCAQLDAGEPLTLFTSPGALASAEDVRAALRTRGVAVCIVEEAHSLAETSHGICPSLLIWRKLLVDLGRPNVVALLAPSGFTTRREVASCLELSAPVVVESQPIRDNVVLELHRLSGDPRRRAFSGLVQELRRPGLVLAQTPREVEEIHGLLVSARVPSHRYHADLTASERLGEQLNFMLPGRKTVMVAQSAFSPGSGVVGTDDERLLEGAPKGFGLGLDKRDLRFIVHWGAPTSAEQLAREVGAVGRDGDQARAIIYCDVGDSNRGGALLMRHRLHPPHAAAVADALDGQALETRKTNFEALALETGLSLTTLASWCTVFEMAGLLRVTSGWVETLAPARDIMECATEISARLFRQQREDERRLSAMRDVLLDAGCHRAALERALGARANACGRCDPCKSGTLARPARRPPAQTFSVTGVDPSGAATPPAQLSARVSEFPYLKTGSRGH